MTCLWMKSHTFGTKDMPRRDSFDVSARDLFGDSPQTCGGWTWPS
jgi:hypothetical protein